MLRFVEVLCTWRKQVQFSLDILTGKKSPTEKESTYEEGAEIWNPLAVDYNSLIDGFDSSKRKVSFKPGIFVINDTENRIAVVDTKTDRNLANHLFQFRDENLRFLYRLALGVVESESVKEVFSSLIDFKAIELEKAIRKGTKPCGSDKTALKFFHKNRGRYFDKSFYDEIAKLVSHRKVLDYSHGQAPLTPYSHIRKMNKVLEYNPRDVFLVGDDDLLSISLARRGINVTLVEIDPYTLGLISIITQREKLPIKMYQVDPRDPIPSEINQMFDLYVADPDFTIEAFGLFLSRGLSRLNPGGIGLINFENKRGQRYKAHYLLDLLEVEILEEIKEKWTYVILQNEKIPIRRRRSGKYVIVDYKTDIVLKEAPYSSIMFAIRRTEKTIIPVTDSKHFLGSPNSIYDYDE